MVTGSGSRSTFDLRKNLRISSSVSAFAAPRLVAAPARRASADLHDASGPE
jgi:hypothetical protein